MNSLMLLQRRMTMLGKKEYIIFVDPAVEQICVSNWSSDGIGLTYKDAARVNSVSNKFKSNTAITSFDEFQYFTGVITVASSGFAGCTALQSITLPSSCTVLDVKAFQADSSLTNINLDEITRINAQCFSGASLMGYWVNAPKLSIIDYESFANTRITKILSLGNSITRLERRTFYGCSSLQEAVLPQTLTFIGANCFYACSFLSSINLNALSSLTTLGEGAFRECIRMPGNINFPSLTTLENYVFYNCKQVTGVTSLGNTITTIPNYCFGGSGLVDVVLPSSCTQINYRAFSGCTSLANINVEKVIAFGEDSFRGCSSLTGITFGTGTTSISSAAFSDSSLQNINLNFPNLSSIGGTSFNNTKIRSIQNLGNITQIPGTNTLGCFKSCTNLVSAVLPPTLGFIGTNCFSGDTALTGVTFGSSRTGGFIFGESVFWGTTNIRVIEMPTGTTEIGASCFREQGGQTYNASVAADLDFVVDCPNLTSLGTRSFYRSRVQHITNLGQITSIPNAVSSQGTFMESTYLLDVVLPSGVTAIPGYSFYGCTHLQSINLSGITGLIDQNAFYNCYALTGITTSASGISASSFRNCSAMTEVHLSDNVSTIGGYAFAGTALSFIEIGSGITSIGNNAFQASSSDVKMTVIVRAETVPTLGNTNFVIRSNIKSADIYVPYSADHSILNAYKAAANWSDFSSTIYELDASGNIPT